ncbi:GNAT family N-acetyltransferase [Streptomyces sp. NBC_01803]|uniref:GNAT family N-acetyltransferase n=1 Tax=Streptomyces sp. NBC_01803 TaxID=2975946 RepID=UPI002DD8CE55|nr:GNAT family N-acetyltransferase [Streptomyces sp. NBC_01803]WSA46963.1 N-acetyltransferase [Streptomyces sp. NBC_01803]
MSATVSVRDNTDAARFEAWIGEELTGFADYARTGSVVEYSHTEVRPDHEGEGIGGALARTALEDARERDLRVRVSCPFISGWLRRHPEYQDLQDR